MMGGVPTRVRGWVGCACEMRIEVMTLNIERTKSEGCQARSATRLVTSACAADQAHGTSSGNQSSTRACSR